MSPLSVSDTLPLDPDLFDVVIFDEASQIPLEEAIPAIYRAAPGHRRGDEMQLPPTTFFATARNDEESFVVEEEGEQIEMDLDSDSFLTQSAQNLPSTLLAWHYRSRYESLISFSNAAFYSGNLYTIQIASAPCAPKPDPRHPHRAGQATWMRYWRAASVFISSKMAFTKIGAIRTKPLTSRTLSAALLRARN